MNSLLLTMRFSFWFSTYSKLEKVTFSKWRKHKWAIFFRTQDYELEKVQFSLTKIHGLWAMALLVKQTFNDLWTKIKKVFSPSPLHVNSHSLHGTNSLTVFLRSSSVCWSHFHGISKEGSLWGSPKQSIPGRLTRTDCPSQFSPFSNSMWVFSSWWHAFICIIPLGPGGTYSPETLTSQIM